MKVGTLAPKGTSKGIVIQDGTIIGYGDEFWYMFYGTPSKNKCTGIVKSLNSGEILIITDGGHWRHPENCFSTEQKATRTTIKNDKEVCVGDTVWLWRWSGTTVSIVRKQVCAIKPGQGFNGMGLGNATIQCTYLDHFWPRKEAWSDLYASKEDAIKDKPEWAKRMDVALFRAGQAA